MYSKGNQSGKSLKRLFECDYLFKDELNAEPEFLLVVNLQFVELFDQNVELLRTQFVQDATSFSHQDGVGILKENIYS